MNRVVVAIVEETDHLLGPFAASLRSRGLSENTVRSYVGHVRRFAEWYEQSVGGFDPTAVTPLDVAEYRRWLQDRGSKPATVNLVLVALSRFFAWAADGGACSLNPAAGVKRVPEQVPGPRWLDRKGVGALMRAVMRYGTVRDRVLIMLLLHTGLRVSEACSLRVDDVELRERSGWLRVRHGKGGKYREEPLNVTVRRVLKECLDSHRPGGDWLFTNRYGERLNERSTERMVRKYARLAGLDRVTVHTLRHTFCKMLVDAGESLDRVAALAGHASLNTTARYTKPSFTDLEKAVGKLAWE
ncbi:MAG: tyrosine-type recombinase/integrase [Bacillota bacterium]